MVLTAAGTSDTGKSNVSDVRTTRMKTAGFYLPFMHGVYPDLKYHSQKKAYGVCSLLRDIDIHLWIWYTNACIGEFGE